MSAAFGGIEIGLPVLLAETRSLLEMRIRLETGSHPSSSVASNPFAAHSLFASVLAGKARHTIKFAFANSGALRTSSESIATCIRLQRRAHSASSGSDRSLHRVAVH